MSKETSVIDYDAAFTRLKAVAKKAKLEYEEIFAKMLQQLSPNHLEPFAEILLQHDNRALKSCESIENLRSLLHEQLLAAHNVFWEEHNVEYGITALEMLKEQYVDCKQIDWNIHKKTPQERVCNVRVRLLKAQANNLHKQVKHQQKQLQLAMAENIAFRDSFTLMKIHRKQISDAMTECARNFDQNKATMRKIGHALLESIEDENFKEENEEVEQQQTVALQHNPETDSDTDETSIECITIDDDSS